MGEPGGLLADVRMAAQRRVERLGYTLALDVAQRGRLGQEVLGLLPQYGNGRSQLQEFLFRLAHQFHEDMTVPTALAAKAPHDFAQFPVEVLRLTREERGSVAALLRDVFDERQGFFCALYSVVASVTR